MKFSSPWARATLAVIILCAIIIPSTNITQEAEDAYDRAAYEALLASMPTPAPATPSPVPSPTPEQTASYSATPAPVITEAPTELPELVFELPMDTYAGGYAPQADGFFDTEVTLPDGTVIDAEGYSDPTIEAIYYEQRYYSADCHFVRIKIKHPSQLRTAIAKEVVGSSRSVTSKMAAAKNAVVAINGEFYTQRESSVFIVKQSQMIKSSPASKLHQLIIDTSGNFHITTSKSDSAAMIQQLNGQIYQGFSFGPALVVDGEMRDYPGYYFDADSGNPRTCIGQLGELEYLLCVVDGRTDDDRGMNTTRLAGIMAEKGCINAYNLDGGGSSTLYWHGKVVNSVNKSGAERDISDCVYFASAWPN